MTSTNQKIFNLQEYMIKKCSKSSVSKHHFTAYHTDLVSAGSACDSLLRQAHCDPVLLPGHLYTLPLCHAPTGPQGHTVKHFLKQSQDSWQINYFFADRHRNYPQSIDPAPRMHSGVQQEQRQCGEMNRFLLFVFWNLQANPQLHKSRAGFLVPY